MVTSLMDEVEAVVCLGFSKALDTVSLLSGKTGACGLDRCTVCWLKNWLDGWAQRVVVTESHPAAGWPPAVSPGLPVGASPVQYLYGWFGAGDQGHPQPVCR